MDEEYRQRAVRQGQVASFDVPVKTCAGKRIWVGVSALVFEALRSSAPVVVQLAHDITMAKRRGELASRLAATTRNIIAITDDLEHLLPVNPLTEQEQRLLRVSVEGKPPSEIASALGSSALTLHHQQPHPIQKLGTDNRLQAVMHSIRRKLIWPIARLGRLFHRRVRPCHCLAGLRCATYRLSLQRGV